MKKKILLAVLTVTAAIAITACADKGAATAGTTAAAQTEAVTTEAATKEEATTKAAADGESKASEELSAAEIEDFTTEIQNAVANEDLEALAELSGYPVYVSLKEGEGSEIKTKEEFLKLDKSALFTTELKSAIAAVSPDELEVYGAGVILGAETNIIFNKVDGKIVITGINL